MELLTEFIDTSDPDVVDQTADVTDGLTDQTLRFGKLQLVPGRVFQVGTLGQAITNTDSDDYPENIGENPTPPLQFSHENNPVPAPPLRGFK